MSWFSSDTESPAHLRTTRTDPLQQQIEPAQTQCAASLHFHLAVIPPPGITIYNFFQQALLVVHQQKRIDFKDFTFEKIECSSNFIVVELKQCKSEWDLYRVCPTFTQ